MNIIPAQMQGFGRVRMIVLLHVERYYDSTLSLHPPDATREKKYVPKGNDLQTDALKAPTNGERVLFMFPYVKPEIGSIRQAY
jgi:hypothetical protein